VSDCGLTPSEQFHRDILDNMLPFSMKWW